MKITMLSTTRRILTALWAAILLVLVVLVAGSHLAPVLDHEVLIIRGRSMTPAIPLGAIVIVEHVQPADLRPHDVVTVRMPNGVAVTHRVVRILDLPAGQHLELKGDANPSIDPSLIPATALVGRVAHHVPVAGYVLTMLSVPTGMVSMLSTVGSLFLAVCLLEEIEAGARRARRRAPVAEHGLPA